MEIHIKGLRNLTTELAKDTADFTQSWNPKKTGLRRKLEKKLDSTQREI